MAYKNIAEVRDAFLKKTNDQLLVKEFTNATDSELILSGALVRAFDSVNSFNPAKSSPIAFVAGLGDLSTYLTDLDNKTIFEDLLIDSQSVTAIATSTTAMAAIISSVEAMSIAFSSQEMMSAIIASPKAIAAITSNSTALNVLLADSVAMSAIIASPTAISAVVSNLEAVKIMASSSAIMNLLNGSTVAMDALYNSLLTVKSSYAIGAIYNVGNGQTLRNGSGLFVRLTTKGGAPWGEGAVGNEFLIFDNNSTTYSGRSAKLYNHTIATASPRILMQKFTSTFKTISYGSCEIAYIPF